MHHVKNAARPRARGVLIDSTSLMRYTCHSIIITLIEEVEMNLTKREKRIDEIQQMLPKLQKELNSLIARQQHKCNHPYVIGWKKTSTGLVMTNGMAGCPRCGLVESVTGGHTAILPPIFKGKPTHWVLKRVWEIVFLHSTISERFKLVKDLSLKSPQ